MMRSRFLIASCTNSDEILAENLLESPDIKGGMVSFLPIRQARSAASAYAEVLERESAEIIIFLHQDIYLPKGWIGEVEKIVDALNQTDPEWAVLGSYGATSGGQHVGYVYDGCNRRVLGNPVDTPTPVAILDEIVIIVRRASNVRFDPELPGFHMYGTEIGLQARSQNKGVYVANLPVVHNSESVATLDASFGRAWRFISRRWRNALPVPNLMCKQLDGSMWPLWRWRLRNRFVVLMKHRILFPRLPDPKQAALDSGFES